MPSFFQCLLEHLYIGLQYLFVVTFQLHQFWRFEEVIFAKLLFLHIVFRRAATLNHIFIQLIVSATAARQIAFDSLILALAPLSASLFLRHLRLCVLSLALAVAALYARLCSVAHDCLCALEQPKVIIIL